MFLLGFSSMFLRASSALHGLGTTAVTWMSLSEPLLLTAIATDSENPLLLCCLLAATLEVTTEESSPSSAMTSSELSRCFRLGFAEGKASEPLYNFGMDTRAGEARLVVFTELDLVTNTFPVTFFSFQHFESAAADTEESHTHHWLLRVTDLSFLAPNKNNPLLLVAALMVVLAAGSLSTSLDLDCDASNSLLLCESMLLLRAFELR
mmetsp:Transcript_4831/g.6676  ORF Transcript_4831/g.6676 Transcript_4831/m.6676 type:complete len:207 (+) Transcript_4831:592-1212(+)